MFSVLFQMAFQGSLLFGDVPGHLTVDIREEELKFGLQLPLGLLEGLHHLEIEGWRERDNEAKSQSWK